MRAFVRDRLRLHRERGATMLEFALVLPLLVLLVFGTAEAGLGWTENNRVEGAASTAARVGAAAGQDATADEQILIALKASLTPESLANLDRVIIFKPANADGGLPASCNKPTGSTSQVGVNGSCNSYSGAGVRAVTSDTATTDLGSNDDYWRGELRNDSLADPPDYLGVYVRTRHDSKTGVGFGNFTITRTSIYRLQPDIDG